ncbi:MAG: hypothetical protein FWF23_04685 [Alphaproteobacteria bacterium]|nr:hypothetical protein [Alphaproteobacteria bacterium]MCL2505546.1 hypothetical protein [Alphaproteobacteria bacterium]
MMKEFLEPMLDSGSPRVLNINVLTKNILKKDPDAQLFFTCRHLNNVVLIKDADNSVRNAIVGTKLYFPFNEEDIYEGGRTIFAHTTGIENVLMGHFGQDALPRDALSSDMRILKILDKLPSLDPFLLKDIFITEKIDMNSDYFEVSDEMWDRIEFYILQGFTPLAKAAFPDAVSSDEVARKLIAKMWEGRDLETLKPMIMAFRIPQGKEHETFAAWKGIMFYGFQYERMKAGVANFISWLNEVKLPFAVVSPGERKEILSVLENNKNVLKEDWVASEKILKEYQSAYDKMFKYKQGSADFLKFIQNSDAAYVTLGNKLGKIGHAVYCWETTTSRYPERKMPWEPLLAFLALIAKILIPDRVY